MQFVPQKPDTYFITHIWKRYGILVLFVERSIFITAEKRGILVLDLEDSNYLSHTRGMFV